MKGVLKKIEEEILYCRKCNLWRERKNPVVGEGSWEAKIMFVGEAPGANEDEKGIPFCGAAGKILDELLNTIGIKREEIYITNILKCRPPQNRNPKEEEIIACSPYLDRQIEIIKPEIICCLGNFSTFYIMKKFGLKGKIQGISRIHGKIFEESFLFGSIKIVPLYHPAVATYNVNMKPLLKKDFEVLKSILE
ncbi:MAG: uracil-DNA glycosylase [Candidatus Omnitrophota bacterium]|nr:MAG: uracil-DNA glycosylase [Candidatus Omnitrophota bacterium]HDN85831.1 uracil-DNA glycosylase [Candidatus Omnitrophota bacterium]